MSSMSSQDSEDLYVEVNSYEDFLITDNRSLHYINQNEFNDLVQDLQLFRSKAVILASRLQHGTYRHRTQEFSPKREYF